LLEPQLYNLRVISRLNYQKFFFKIKKEFNILDLTPYFLKKKNYQSLYINDKYGGHLNKNGNIFISKLLKKIT